MVRSAVVTAAAVLALAAAQVQYAYSAGEVNGPLTTKKADALLAPVDAKILTLDQCIELALKNNPGLQIEQEKITELENDYTLASSGLYPKLSASAYYIKVNPDRVGIQPL